ncbi:MAG: hypothetical protein LBK01_06695, partial [Burkholderiaceae bacterium]|nr:hypothetical protein [Burkholderiaceae bacterium]
MAISPDEETAENSDDSVRLTPTQSARYGFFEAYGKNADTEAKLQRLAKIAGVPVDTIRYNEGDYKRRINMVSTDFDNMPPSTARTLSNPQQAAVMYDDVDNMSLLETVVNSFRRGVVALEQRLPQIQLFNLSKDWNTFTNIDARIANGENAADVLRRYQLGDLIDENATSEEAKAIWEDYRSAALPEIDKQMKQNVYHLTDLNNERNRIRLPSVVARASSQKDFGDALSEIAKHPLLYMAGIIPESLVQSATGMVVGGAVTALTKNPVLGGVVMGADSYLTDFMSKMHEELQKAGVNIQDPNAVQAALKDPEILAKITDTAWKHAAPVALFDAISGGMAGKSFGKLLTPKTWGNKALRTEIVNLATQAPLQGVLGGAGEALGQLASGEELHWGEILAEFFGEMGGAPAEVMSMSMRRWSEQAVKAADAIQNAEQLRQTDELVAQSKLRERSPETFKEWADGFGGEQSLFITAHDIRDSGVADQLVAAVPSIAEQYDAGALEMNGLIEVPLSEYLTYVAATELSAPVAKHWRFDPDALSEQEAQTMQDEGLSEAQRAEVTEAFQRALQDEDFQQSANRVTDTVLAEMAPSTTSQPPQGATDAGSDGLSPENATVGQPNPDPAITENIRAQLDEAGKYKANENRAQATLVGQAYATLAARFGISPEALYARLPMRVVAGGGNANSYYAALKAQPPRGWVHAERPDAAAGLWNGTLTAESVYWTDLEGKLAQDAPDMAGYSHSISNPSIGHIKKAHGDEKTEVPRGQLPITEKDIARIPEIVTSYDDIRTDLRSPRTGEQYIAYSKGFDDGVIVYIEGVTHKRRNMRGVSMWKYPPRANARQVLAHAVSPDIYAQERLGAYGDDSTTGDLDGINTGYQQNRGAYNPSTFTISLLEEADLSTFLHESGHHFLEILTTLANEQGAPVGITNDVQTLMNWFGVDNLDAWNNMSLEQRRPYHEQFAQGFEKYLFEGKAPTPQLQSLFQQFRDWLVEVYESLTKLNVNLTDEVREVFDHLIALDTAVTEAQNNRGMSYSVPGVESGEYGQAPAPDAVGVVDIDPSVITDKNGDPINLKDTGALRNWLFEQYRGKSVRIEGDGRIASFTTEGLKSSLKRRGKAQREVYARLEETLKNAVHDSFEKSDARHPHLKGQEVYYSAVRVGTQLFSVRFKLYVPIGKEISEYKDHKVSEVQIAPALYAGYATNDKTRQPADAIHSVSLPVLKGEVNPSGIDDGVLYQSPVDLERLDKEAQQEALDTLQARSMRAAAWLAKARTREINKINQEGAQQRKLVRDQIEQDVMSEPVYQAWAYLTRPGPFNKFQVSELEAVYATNAGRYAEKDWKPLSNRKMTTAKPGAGMGMDEIAEMFGFDSGHDIVDALLDATPPKEEIEARTNEAMFHITGGLDEKQIAEMADEATHNEGRTRFLVAGANFISDSAKIPRLIHAAVRNVVKDLIGKTPIRDINPTKFGANETRAARSAENARRKGDLVAEANARRGQAVQNMAAKEAYQAVDAVEKGVRY